MYKFLFYITLIILSFTFLHYKYEEYKNNKQILNQGTLLPDQKKTIITKDNSMVTKTLNEKTGKVEVKVNYIPPESKQEVIIKKNGDVEVDYNTYGLTISPFASCIFSKDITGALGIRFLYWNRYGLGLSLDNQFTPYLTIDRRIDDILFNNLAVALNISIDKIGFGISIYF